MKEFAETLTANFATATANPAQAEDQLKGPLQQLLKAVGAAAGFAVQARTEARTELGVRPDLGVTVDGLLAGHIELKAPGKGVRPKRFPDAHDREQFRKLADHPNLLYTDGNEWALYRHGDLVGSVVSADGDVTTDGAGAFLGPSALALETMLQDFLRWEPLVPSTPKALAELLAPLTRLLRENVTTALADPGSALSKLAGEWRSVFFPDADDAQFADAYAQTVTYALLLARVEGETDLRRGAADRLDERHGLLAQVLRVLAEPSARAEVVAAIELLERSIAAVDPEELARRAKDRDLWLYFYEDFLSAYDPQLRKQRGVYYTPAAVVQAQVTLVAELLREQFGKPLGFADDEVTVLDPAVGTGTYLLAALQSGLDVVRAEYGVGAIPARATAMASSFHGFELLIGSYAVAHLRVSKQVLDAGGELPDDGAHIYLTDTLESPHEAPPGYAHAPLFQRKLAHENERARHVKASVPILVCIGNPPYFRQVIGPDETGVERMGGWVREGDHGKGGILRDFIRDTPGVHVKNLYNLYVYFWRWALWKVFENVPGPGIVSFITASSYLRGPGFAGMRRQMRETFDDLWILDLGGEGRGARKSENVFDIQTPVAIAVGVRYEAPNQSVPARVAYARIEGTRVAKFETLDRIQTRTEVDWRTCYEGWAQPFLPESDADFFSWPLLTDLFPWQQSGVKAGRTWPIAPDRSVLFARWERLLSSAASERARLFKDSPTGRKSTDSTRALPPAFEPREPIASATNDEPAPAIPYPYRVLDRQYVIADARLLDRPSPSLWRTAGPRQLFMVSFVTNILGEGPAVAVASEVPDFDFFRGSYGGRHVVPLWRDSLGIDANVTADLLDDLGRFLVAEIEPTDLFAYCYAVLSAPDYTERFAEELEIPGPRVPITEDTELFRQAVALGERLIWLHTFGERLVPPGERAGRIPRGRARLTKPVGTTAATYPISHSYDPGKQQLCVGDGVFEPVSKEVRAYSVSGLDVIGSWLDYRMKQGAGKKSSPLDDIRPEVWPAEFNEELLHVLWIIEHTIAMSADLNETLDTIVSGATIAAADLPTPTEAERAPPPG
ncbi:MAG TPA: type ISP restriction/modification enzyme [Gaiellaceae bacterium]|nr:type ISP restriction/modification enzyme [Gaiellaceae bacterium]